MDVEVSLVITGHTFGLGIVARECRHVFTGRVGWMLELTVAMFILRIAGGRSE